MTNNQQPESRLSDPITLEVHSIFRTIQGEGPFAGVTATFVRLAGCNLQCPGCDTDYTSTRARWLADELAHEIHNEGVKLVVITGGEPFRQNMEVLVGTLLRLGHTVQFETNGVLAPTDTMFYDYHFAYGSDIHLVVSPKTGRVHRFFHKYAKHWKYVIKAGACADDLLPTTALSHPLGREDRVARPQLNDVTIYVQPEDEDDEFRNHENMRAAVVSVYADPRNRRLCLQMHKYADLD